MKRPLLPSLPAAARRWIAALLICLTATAAWGDELERAQAFFDEGDFRAAEVTLKALLQQDPSLIDARLLLGRVYLRLGDGAAAEKELGRAAELGSGGGTLGIDRAEALLQQRQFEAALELLDPLAADASVRAAVHGMRGRALLGLGRLDEARAEFAAATEIDPNDRIAGLGLAQLALLTDDTETAAATVEGLMSRHPEDIQLLLLRAEIYRKAGEPEAALARFEAVLEQEPGNLPALLGQATMLVTLQQFDQAREVLDRIEEVRPGVIAVSYLRGVMAFYERDWDAAAKPLELVLSARPRHVQSLLLMGIVAYARNDLQIAAEYLSRVLTALPDNMQAAKVLAATYLKLREPALATEILEPLAGDGDPQIMALLGSAYMLAGEEEQGQQWLTRAVEAAPDVAALRTQLALTLIAGGRTGEAIAELESAVDLGQEVLQADVLLVLTLLKEGKHDEALAASEALEARLADSPVSYNLTGLALLSRNQLDRARAKFDEALSVDPTFTTALINLARVEMAEDKPEAAAEHYRRVLEKDPKNLAAQLGMAGLAERRGDPEALEEWLNKAQDANPNATQPGLLLARWNIDRGEYLKALTVASDLAARFPMNADVLEMLGRAQTLTGEPASAIRTFRQVAERRPEDARILYLLGGAQWKAEDPGAAARSFRQAIRMAPDYTDAKVALASVLLAARDYDAAATVARGLQQDQPDSPLGYRLEGRIQAAARNPEAAARAFEQALEVRRDPETVRALAEVYARADAVNKAIGLLEGWTAEVPNDVPARTFLAMLYQGEGREDQALPLYEALYRAGRANVVVLNNLAWILQERGDPRAAAIAGEAYEMAPNRPEVADTYGWILYNSGNRSQGLNILQQAHLAYPTQTEIAYHVAVALEGVGRGDEAVKVLRKLLREYPNAPEAPEARALMRRLAPAEAG